VSLDNSGDASIVASDVDNGSTDACGLASLSLSPSSFDCNDLGSNTVSLRATDMNGNEATCTANVEITWDPVSFSAAPRPVCQNGTVSFTDNSLDAVNWSWDFGDGSAGSTQQNPTHIFPDDDTASYDITLTITTSDGCTLSKTLENYIRVDQPISKFNLNPANGCSIPHTVFFTDQSTLPDTWLWNFGDNNTSTLQNPVHNYTSFGVFPVSLIVVDTINGCTDTAYATVRVEDNDPPTALCQSATLALAANGQGTLLPANVDGGSSDNCGIESMSVSPSTFDCNHLGQNTVTLSVADARNQSAQCTAMVTVTDPLSACCDAPVAICQDITVQLDANGEYSLAASEVDNGSSADCGGLELEVDPDLLDCDDIGVETVTLTASDINEDSDQCTASVTVQDNIPPSFSHLTCGTPSNAAATAYNDGWQSGDNDGSGFGPWSLAPATNNNNEGFFLGEASTNGSSIFNGSANDSNGDNDIDTDGKALGLYANGGFNFEARATRSFLGAFGKGSVLKADFDNGFIDNGSQIEFILRSTTNINSIFVRMVGGGTHYALQDAYGLTIFTSIPYTDEGIHVEVTNLGGDQYEVELTRLVDGVSQSLIASVAPGVMIGGIQIVNGNAGSGITRNLYINNMAICHPTPGCPSNIAVNTDPEVCGAVVSYDDIVAVDNCTNQPTISQIAGQASGTFFAVGTTTNTFTASDANGNTASCSFDVTVTDNEAPTVTCQDLTLGLDATGQASLALSNTELANSVNDFSGVQGSNGWEYGTNSAFNSAGFTRLPNFTGFVWNNPGATLDFPQLDAQGGHPNLDNLFWAVRRWTSNYSGAIRISGDFFDRDVSCGAGANVRIFKNGTEVYQYLNISGTSTPYSLQLTIQPGDQIDFAIDPKFTGGCDDTHFTAVITEQGVAASFDDNCGVASLSASPTVFDCQDIGNHTVTLQVTDNNGNMASCTSNVKVIDDVAPVAKCQDLTVQLDANGQYVLAASEADNGSSDNCQLASVVINGFSSVTLGCGNVNVPATVPLRATDASGNSSICQVTITTLDVTPPTAICQPATVVLSSVDGTGSITVSDVDGGSSDACGIASLTASPSQFDCSMVGNNTVTLMVTDNNGNVASCTTTVFVDDSQSKPATLAQQNCGNCGQIQIFYCRYDAAPAGLNDFIDGAEQTNGNYVSGNTLFWYDDNGGSQGGAHMGTGQEPATPSTATPSTTFYWVAQIDQNTGCFGDAIRVRVRVRNTPDPVLTAPTTPFCEGAQIDLASRVSDNNNNADVYDFYDGDPNAGGILIGSVTATNGTVDAGQNIVVTPVVGNNTYWVVATNTAGNFNIPCPATTSMSFVVTAKPVVTPISDIKACPGDPILVNFSAAPASNPIFIWTNSNTNIGLGVSGFGNPNFTAAANSSGAAEVGNIAVRAISNGCPSDLEQFTITVNSDGVIDPSSSVTVCSGQPTGMTLATAVGGPAAASYELVSVSLDAGLVADGGNQAPGASLGASALAADRYTNHSSASLTATYSLRVITVDNCTSAVQTVTATILPAPVVTANLADTVCSGQPANLTLSTVNSLPATSFSWAPQSLPAGISLINSSSPGSVISDILTNSTASPIDVIFDVTATAGNCASIVVPCTIRVVPFPSVPPTASLSACEDPNNPGQASFNLSSLDQAIGGGLTVNYFTDPNLLNPILQPGAFLSGNTTVYASVVNPTAPCPNRTDISLTVGSLAVPQVSSSTFPCSNTSQAIAPTPVLGISFHFYNNDPDLGGTLLGSGASYDPMLSTGQSQTIWVIATDGNCESDAVSTTVTVLAAPTASISSNLSNGQICEGDTLELFGSGGGTYSWTGPNGFSSTQQNVVIPGFVLADTGEYILTVSNGLCSRPDTIYVVGNRIADPGQNGTLTIAANAAPVNLFNYLLGSPQPGGVWAGPSSPYGGDLGTFNPNFMYSGVYTYTLTNPGACRDSVVFATVTVNVTPVTAAKVRARVFLEGVLDTTSFLMVDSLRKNLFMPTVEPYGQMGYAHVNGGGNESIPVSMLNTTGNNALVDWVYIELRRANDFTHIEATRSALLQRDGDIVELDGVSPVCFNRVSPGFYYVVIGHRNHLSVMTASTVFLNSAGTINLDFTSGVLGVYGTNPQNITATTVITGGVRVMVGGDADFNGQVQNVDDVNFWAIQVGGSGYLESDYDCNGQVQNSDRVNVWNPNVGKGTQVPVRSN
jgi:PKD repeat protein